MKIKVLVVDDSAFMRKVISDILVEDKDIEVIGFARNGEEALEKINILKPNVVTLDVEMPLLNGIETLDKIMIFNPVPVVMLSSLTIEGADATLKALEIGAIDFITKPNNIFGMGSSDKKTEIIEKVKMASKVKNISSTKLIEKKNFFLPNKTVPRLSNQTPAIIAIGTSTGGPRALQSIIPNLPADINGSILVVQHMPPGFTKSLANRLDALSKIRVKEAENGEVIKKGYCYIAPGGYHMEAVETDGKVKIRINDGLPVSGHKPSVDLMMDSVSKINSMFKVGVILTGMGSDGAKGLEKIKKNKGYTIAQDEESSVVFGMPKSAIKLNIVDKVLPLNKIANEIISKVGC